MTTLQTAASLDAETFKTLGNMQVAYMRAAITAEGAAGIAIHAADGSVIGFAANREQAIGAIIQHGMEPVALH